MTTPFTMDASTLPEKYRDLVMDVASKAQEHLSEFEHLLAAAFIYNSESKHIDIVASHFTDEDKSKDGFAEFVRQRASRMSADAIIMTSEAWALPEYLERDPKAAMAAMAQYGQVSKHPERRDIVMFVLHTHDGIWLGRGFVQPATPGGPTDEGKGRTIDGIDWAKTDGAGGRFASLLPIKYATADEATKAINYARKRLSDLGVDPDRKLHNHSIMEMVETAMRQAPAKRLDEKVIDEMVVKFAAILRFMDVAAQGRR